MTTDSEGGVLEPACRLGTKAYVAEQLGRRWITVDTSRVALTLARTRLVAVKYPYYVLTGSRGGIAKEVEMSGQRPPPPGPPRSAGPSPAPRATAAPAGCRTDRRKLERPGTPYHPTAAIAVDSIRLISAMQSFASLGPACSVSAASKSSIPTCGPRFMSMAISRIRAAIRSRL